MPERVGEAEAAEIMRQIAEKLEAQEGDSAAGKLAGLLFAAGLALYAAEKDSSSEINTLGDALWFTLAAASATGESGRTPVTPAGKLISSAVIVLGHPLWDKTKGEIMRYYDKLSSSRTSIERQAFERELLAKLDFIGRQLQELNAKAEAG